MNQYFKAEGAQKALAWELNFHSLTCKTKQAGLQHPIKAEITDIQTTETETQERHRTEGRSIKEGLMRTLVTAVSQDAERVAIQLGLPSSMLGWMKMQIKVHRNLFDSTQTHHHWLKRSPHLPAAGTLASPGGCQMNWPHEQPKSILRASYCLT